MDVPNIPNVTTVAYSVDIAFPPTLVRYVAPASKGSNHRAFILHTSGTSGGSPKLVFYQAKWMEALFTKMRGCWVEVSSSTQDVISSMGSLCHVGQWFVVFLAIQRRACVIQPSTIAYSTQELLELSDTQGLNRLFSFSPYLKPHLDKAKSDERTLDCLRGMRQIIYSGVPLDDSVVGWAFESGIPLMVSTGPFLEPIFIYSRRTCLVARRQARCLPRHLEQILVMVSCLCMAPRSTSFVFPML
jgi:hypothetical protein